MLYMDRKTRQSQRTQMSVPLSDKRDLYLPSIGTNPRNSRMLEPILTGRTNGPYIDGNKVSGSLPLRRNSNLRGNSLQTDPNLSSLKQSARKYVKMESSRSLADV